MGPPDWQFEWWVWIWLVFVPSPSCPVVLSPQHHRLPSLLMAQVCADPAPTTIQSVPGTGVGTLRCAVVPSPSWPLSLSPQHASDPSAWVAQVWEAPPLTR
jgi:hypothetical protein